MSDFEATWKIVTQYLSSVNHTETLVQNIKNNIIKVGSMEIKVRSEKTGKVRSVPKTQFEQIWELMSSQGYYCAKDHKPYVHSRIISAIFVRSGISTATYNPLTIRIKR